MHCPECNHKSTVVTSTLCHPTGKRVRRYRKCPSCGHTFRTTQQVERLDDDGVLWNIKRPAGTKSPSSFFTQENIADIRKLRKYEGWSADQLAKKYGCHPVTIRRILRRARYQDVPE